MKKLLLALFLVFTLPLSAEEQPAVPTADEQAAALINAQEWFRLEACYPEIRDELSPFVRLLCEASLGSHFNRLPESCNAIGTLLNDYQQELFADPEGSMLGWLLSMLIGNLQELGAYEQAADLLTQFAAGQSEEERASTLATQRWFQTMARHPRTSLTKPDGEIRLPLTVGSETVKSPLDGTDKKVHNFYTDITIGGRTERFIFDTGCSGASFVSAEFAKRHDLEIICDSIPVSGIGGNGFVKFATTDSMQIGPVTIRHPYFMVFDNDEASDQIGHIEAVLGTDFMRLAGQIELRPKEGFFLLPATPEPTPASGRNLMHDTSSGQYILNTLVAGKDTVPMVFDTGNSRTGLSPNYYTLHREEIDRSGKKRETAAGGFGGILRGTGYDLKNITFTIGDGSRTLKKVTVTADFGPASEQPYFGSLGMDLFRKVRPHRLRLRPDVRYGGINPAVSVPHPARPNCPSFLKIFRKTMNATTTVLQTDSLLFRPTLPDDLERICTIIRQAQAQMRLRGSRQWQNGYPAAAHITDDIDRGYGHVLCTHTGLVVAYGAVVFDGEPAYAEIDGTWLDQAPYVVLHRLAVAQEVKGQGIATEFMRRTMTLARERGTGSFRIDTNFDNRCMLRLLAKFGFVRCGEIHYAGDPRIAFQKIL